jgi:hypothetical protein
MASPQAVEEVNQGTFVIRLVISKHTRHHYGPAELRDVIQATARRAITELESRPKSSAHMLKCPFATKEEKRHAALSLRGRKAAAHFKAAGYPGMAKARKAMERWRVEQFAKKVAAMQGELDVRRAAVQAVADAPEEVA